VRRRPATAVAGAGQQLHDLETDGRMDNLTFAWRAAPHRRDRHYYRVQGPTLLIEHRQTRRAQTHPTIPFGEAEPGGTRFRRRTVWRAPILSPRSHQPSGFGPGLIATLTTWRRVSGAFRPPRSGMGLGLGLRRPGTTRLTDRDPCGRRRRTSRPRGPSQRHRASHLGNGQRGVLPAMSFSTDDDPGHRLGQ